MELKYLLIYQTIPDGNQYFLLPGNKIEPEEWHMLETSHGHLENAKNDEETDTALKNIYDYICQDWEKYEIKEDVLVHTVCSGIFVAGCIL